MKKFDACAQSLHIESAVIAHKHNESKVSCSTSSRFYPFDHRRIRKYGLHVYKQAFNSNNMACCINVKNVAGIFFKKNVKKRRKRGKNENVLKC